MTAWVQVEAPGWGLVSIARGGLQVRPPSVEAAWTTRMGSSPWVPGLMKGNSGRERSTSREVEMNSPGARSVRARHLFSPGPPSQSQRPRPSWRISQVSPRSRLAKMQGCPSRDSRRLPQRPVT